MLKNFLKRWGPVLMFIVVLGLCVGLVFLNLTDPETEPEVTRAETNKVTVEKALAAGKVAPSYVASDAQAQKIKYLETLKFNLERNKRTVASDEPIGVFVSYPQPVRPKSEPPPPPMGQDDVVAKMPLLDSSKFRAEADRGKVYVKCELPPAAGYLMMEPVRFEIFRGLAKDKIDLSKPWGTIEVGLETPPAPVAAGTAPAAPAAAAPAEESSRRQRQNAATPAAPNGRNAPTAAPFPLPATERVFRDTTDIGQTTTYFYQVRLVARFTSVEGKKEMSKRADGTSFELVHHQPNDKKLTPVKSANPTTVLFATPLTDPVSATTPTNFELRLAGIRNPVPPPGTVRNPAAHDNKSFSVTFEVRAWIQDIGDWKTVQVENVTEGDTLSGKIVYTKGGEKKEYDFTKDLGYKLYEVNLEEVPSAAVGQTELKEVAILENLKTKAMEKRVKMAKAVSRKETLNVFDKLIDAQDREMKKLREAPPPVIQAPAPGAVPAPAGAAGTAPVTPGSVIPPGARPPR